MEVKGAILFMLRVYQSVVSPLLPPSCRFYPSCSEYAAQAVSAHGALRGSAMAAKRLLKCHPFHAGGYDPVAVPGVSEDRK